METFEVTDMDKTVPMKVPDGFKRISWDDVEMEDTVYLATSNTPIGPYRVYDAGKHMYASITEGGPPYTDEFDSLLVKDEDYSWEYTGELLCECGRVKHLCLTHEDPDALHGDA